MSIVLLEKNVRGSVHVVEPPKKYSGVETRVRPSETIVILFSKI